MNRLTVRRFLCSTICTSLASLSLGQAGLFAQDDLVAPATAPPSVMANEPQSPEEQFAAVLLMLRLDRLDLAKIYLDQFLSTEPTDELLLDLRDDQGTSTFLRLSRIPGLQPQSQRLLELLERASARRLDDPAYFDALLSQLEGSPREREAAVIALRQLGADAVPGLLERLGQGDKVEQHSLLLYTLTKLGPSAVSPLLGAIESPIERTRSLSIEAIGWLGDESTVPYLWYPAFGADQPPLVQAAARQAISRIRFGSPDRTDRVSFNGVIDEVHQRALLHFGGDYEWEPADDGSVLIWSWAAESNRLVKTVTSPQRASAFLAQRLAREAMLMAPESQDQRALFLAASLAQAGYRAGWDRPWPIGPGTAHNLAMFSGARLSEHALQLAIHHRNAAAAVGALKALGQIATPAALADHGSSTSAIVAALDYPSDRVQFAAASCILQIDPQDRIPYGHRVIDILGRSLSDDGGPATVVIDPNTQRGASVAAILSSLGYETAIAATGREGFATAASRGDIQLAVMHPNAIRWELTQTVANFRADARTAGIPIAIYGPRPTESDVRRLLDRTSDSKFIVMGGEAADWHRQLASLVNTVDVPPLTDLQRSDRVQTAAYWLRHIAESCRTDIYDLSGAEQAISNAIENPLVAADAIVALAHIPRATCQARLAEVTSAPGFAPEIRELAAYELSRHIQRYDRLITEATIDELKVAWRNIDSPGLHTALSAVLGSLGTTPEAVGAVLQSHALPTTP